MAWRFKASKYKNAAPIVPKPEAYVRDICVGSYQTYGNNITASAQFMAFNWDYAGSSLAVFPINDSGRKSKLMPLLNAHSDTVTDMHFSPFHDNLLATASQDCLVKIWIIPEGGLKESLCNPECQFSHKQRRVETISFHPTSDYLIHSTSYSTFSLWDLISQKEVFSTSDHSDVIQSVSWKRNGKLVATSCKDKHVRILDPRSEKSCVSIASSHQNIKDSRIVWLGDQDKVLTTGFNAAHLRQVILRDTRNFENPLKTLELDCSTGILMPLFDSDTNMLFLAGKGDATISYMEVADKEPFLLEGLRHSGEQTKGACLVPKRALNIMQCEVNRILQLTGNAVIPVTYQVPRKSYRDFHGDLYPDTPGCKTDLVPDMWLQGEDIPVPKINLDPSVRQEEETNMVTKESFSSLKELTNKKTTSVKLDNKIVSKKENSTHQGVKHLADKFIAPKTNTNGILSEQNIKNEMKSPDKLPTKKEIQPKTDKPKEIGSEEKNTITKSPKLFKPNEEGDFKPKINKPNEENVKEKNEKQESNSTTNGKMDEEFSPHENGDAKAIFPKPKPRTSRTYSTCEEVVAGKPVARPRTNSFTPAPNTVGSNNTPGSYKPLLGPKPFTPFNMRETETFDKVFSVPTAPGRKQQNGLYQTQTTFISHEKFDSSQHAGESNDNDIHENNSDVLQEPYEVDKQIEHDSVQKKSSSKPSQVEEVKQCSKDANNEKNEDFKRNREGGNLPLSQSMSAVVDDDYDEEDSFERSSSERRSIAERRKMYENRSLSVQETSDKLPKSPLHKHTEAFKSGRQSDIKDTAQQKKGETVTTTPPKRTSTVFGRVSKFRHLKGTALHKSQHIENVRNLSRQIPGESDGFHANPTRVAVPLSGPGGKIAIFELKRTGRLPDGVIPALVHGQNVTDFCWDPFDDQRLAVACGDGTVKLWKIPDDGLKEQINEPEIEFCAHSDRIYFVKFHPLAKNVLATGAYDLTIKIWHLSDLDAKIVLLGHTEQISAFAWSPCGKFCATFSKDGLLRIFEPRQNNQPIREGKGPVGTRGGRLTWALNGRFLVVMGFDKVSVRQIMVFQSDNLSAPLNTMTLDVSPSILIPFYDEDSSTLFVTGKGDSTVYAFEITEEAPYICPLSHHRCPSLHQGLSFLPKNCCDVAKVEFAKAFRLTNNTIEPLSFTVPRIKTDLFQDDLFPSTKVSWKPALTGAEWFNGKNTPPQYISLKPEGMEQLSDSVVQETQDHKPAAKMTTTQSSFSNALWNMDKAEIKSKQAKIQQSICDRIEINMKLEQDDMEGVDEKEWEEEE
ncbi:coronin-7 isoform X1 [Agrilus planipennis]|uniref:Coronin n=1 Tax=Agrilus planipennis TaxID=224129 RepID=A0A1W4WS49_AGRPL|nr:coronin-7 isoform X1 [Agrilus planipennis]XP_018326734.1 coronin-7 isoform X1 [Agrilus planipennis]